MKEMQKIDWLLALHAQLNNGTDFWEIPFESPQDVLQSFYKLGINKETNEPEMQPVFDSKDSMTVESIADKLKKLAKSGNLFVNRDSKTENKSELYQIASDAETNEPMVIPFPKNAQEVEALPTEAKGIWASICNFFDQILSLFSDDAKKRLEEKQAANNLKEMEKNIVNDTSKKHTKLWDKIFKSNKETIEKEDNKAAKFLQEKTLEGIKILDDYENENPLLGINVNQINKNLTKFMNDKHFQNHFNEFLSGLSDDMRGKVIKHYTEKVLNPEKKDHITESGKRWLEKTNELKTIAAKKEALNPKNNTDEEKIIYNASKYHSSKMSFFDQNYGDKYRDITNFCVLSSFFEVRDDLYHDIYLSEDTKAAIFANAVSDGGHMSSKQIDNLMSNDHIYNTGPSPERSVSAVFSGENSNYDGWECEIDFRNRTVPNADRYADALTEFIENGNPEPLSEAISDDLSNISKRIVDAKIEGTDEKFLYGRISRLYENLEKIGKDSDLIGKIEEKWQQKDKNFNTVKGGLFLMNARQKGLIAQEKLLDSLNNYIKESKTELLEDALFGAFASKMLDSTNDKVNIKNDNRINLFKNLGNHPEQMAKLNEIKSKLHETAAFKRLANSDSLTIAKNIAKGSEALYTICNLCINEAQQTKTTDKSNSAEAVQTQKKVQKTQTKAVTTSSL